MHFIKLRTIYDDGFIYVNPKNIVDIVKDNATGSTLVSTTASHDNTIATLESIDAVVDKVETAMSYWSHDELAD